MVRPDWRVEAPPVVILALAAAVAPASPPVAALAGGTTSAAGPETTAQARDQAANTDVALLAMLEIPDPEVKLCC